MQPQPLKYSQSQSRLLSESSNYRPQALKIITFQFFCFTPREQFPQFTSAELILSSNAASLKCIEYDSEVDLLHTVSTAGTKSNDGPFHLTPYVFISTVH